MPLTGASTLPEVRDHLGETARKAIELRATPADKRGETFEADLRAAIDDIHFADDVEKALAAEERGRLAKLEAKQEARGPRAAFEKREAEIVSGGREFVAAPGFEEFSKRGGQGMFAAEVRALLTSLTTGPSAGLLRPVGQPYFKPGPEQRRLFVRDLLGVQPTGLAIIPYLQEKNAGGNNGDAIDSVIPLGAGGGSLVQGTLAGSRGSEPATSS